MFYSTVEVHFSERDFSLFGALFYERAEMKVTLDSDPFDYEYRSPDVNTTR